jgi:5-methylcytosine-specific restriction endonuclease McrA
MTIKKKGPRRKAKKIRKKTGRCYYCRTPFDNSPKHRKTRDHVIPQSKGGTKTVACCWLCNNRKGDMSAEQFFKILERERLTTIGEVVI